MNLLFIIYINNIEVLYSVSIKYWQLNADYNILYCIGPYNKKRLYQEKIVKNYCK